MVLVVANSRKAGCGPDHAALIEQGELALHLQHALDDEHHIGPAGVVLVEHERGVRLQRPRQDAFAELGDLLAFADHDGVLADKVDAAHMAVEVDAHARPIQPRRHLLDMRRFAGAVVALDHHAAVVREARQDRQRGLAVEQIVGIELRHIFARLGVGRDLHRTVDAEHLPDRHLHIRQAGMACFTLNH